MTSIQPPLSPSHLHNVVGASTFAVPSRKRIVFEEEDDFMSAALLAEAEMEDEQPPDDLPSSPPRASSSAATDAMGRVADASTITTNASATRPRQHLTSQETVVHSRPGVKEGKKRMVMELEDGFDEDALMEDPTPDTYAAKSSRDTFTHDYTKRYSDLSSVNLSLRPGEYEAAPVQATTLDGRIIRFQRKKKAESWQDSRQQQKEDMLALAKLAGSMLETPYHRMVKDIEHAAILAKKQAQADDTNARIHDSLTDPTSAVDNALWTDRYRPKRFTELLGDERVHRSALLWLKEWDQCVFKGVYAKHSAAADLKRERRKKRTRNGEAGADGGENFENTDPYGRPLEKIMLLTGPPGLGKTTLAHVLARQAGYQVHEVNASDDRTGKVVEERIRNALESRALSGSGGMTGNKPTCVVVDEVDGAGGGGDSSFVRTLVKLVTEGSIVRKHRGKGKGKKDRPLLRPIICICNDLYAPVLRPLRALAKIVRFSPPTNAMLVTRLRSICDDEGLGADAKNLTMLAEIAEGDLRSCLNTLQFIKRRSSVVDEAAIRSTVVGLKDTGTSATQVIDRLFKKPPRKKGGSNSDDAFVNRIVRDVQTSGEYEKISQGCFENYLNVKQLTDTWPRIVEAGDWLFIYDRLDGRLRSDRDYELLGYVPYTFVPWYHLFSSHTSAQLEFPKADYDAYLRRVAHQEIAQTFTASMPHNLKNLFTGANVVGELLPLLNRIIAPELKPVNSQLVRAEERGTLLKLVHQMLTLGLSFVQDKTDDGQLIYKLDPPVDAFVHFDGKRAPDIAASRYAVRHMITHELEAERLRRSEGGGITTTANDILAAYKIKPAGNAVAETKEAVDFFGRAIAAKPQTASQAAAPAPKPRAPQAVYRFHEGFSNAVRVTKKISDFL